MSTNTNLSLIVRPVGEKKILYLDDDIQECTQVLNFKDPRGYHILINQYEHSDVDKSRCRLRMVKGTDDDPYGRIQYEATIIRTQTKEQRLMEALLR
jgi:hypothetical protein